MANIHKKLSLGILILALCGCAPASFESRKQELLQKTPALGGNDGLMDSDPDAVPQPGDSSNPVNIGDGLGPILPGMPMPGMPNIPGMGGMDPDYPSNPTGPSAGPSPVPSGTPMIPVKYLCSDRRTEDNGGNILSAEVLELRYIDPRTKSVVCSDSQGIRESLINTKTLLLRGCPEATGNIYDLKLVNPAVPSSNLLDPKGDLDSVQAKRGDATSHFSIKAGDAEELREEGLFVLYDTQRAGSRACDDTASPLVVDMNPDVSNPQGVRLSSPLDGILFDILGFNSFPFAHAPKQISWIQDARYMFLVRPDAFGSVNGIDQMFGDNTIGPDGKFADDGFHALAKYDSNGDGFIDARDRVYSQLRLWADRNYDGFSQPGELITLDRAGLTAIDLRYDPNFSETDRYGNRTELKSVVKLRDGSLRLIFDLWFRYL